MTDKPVTTKTAYRRFKDYQNPPYDLSQHAAFQKVLKEETDDLENLLDVVTSPKEKYVPGDHGDYD